MPVLLLAASIWLVAKSRYSKANQLHASDDPRLEIKSNGTDCEAWCLYLIALFVPS